MTNAVRARYEWRTLTMIFRTVMLAAVLVAGLVVPNELPLPQGRTTLLVGTVVLALCIARWVVRGRLERWEPAAGLVVFEATMVASVWWAPSLHWLVIAQLVAMPVVAASMFDRRGVAVACAAVLGCQLLLVAHHGEPGWLFLAICAVALVVADVLPVVAILTVTAQLEAARAATVRMAATDQLTGLLNRRGLAEAVPALLASAAAAKQSVTVMVADVDHFKAVNDTYGHDTGDRVLVAVARAMAEVVRADDLLVRLGGEEVAWVAHFASTADVADAAERLRTAVEGIHEDGVPAVTVSIGVATEPPPDASSLVSRLLTAADAGLYEAKRAGRNRVVITGAVSEGTLAVPSPGATASVPAPRPADVVASTSARR